MAKIFISYRHLDSMDITARLWDHLKARFGEPNIFIDYKRMMGGNDFLETIDSAIDSSDILLSIIGPKWKGEESTNHRTRIQDPKDVVRRELERAQRRNMPILVVMVGGANYLVESDLPASLKKLARMHALQLRSGIDFEVDVQRIINCIEMLTNEHSGYRRFLGGSFGFPFSPPLISPISNNRSIILAGLRSSAVLGMSFTVYRFLQWLVTKDVQSLPDLTLLGMATLIIALLGITLLVISGLRTRLAAHFARQRQETALSELAELIFERLETPRLLSAISVRSLALGIERKHRCPVITDKLLTEAIRAAALKLEYTTHGDELLHRMKLLNKLLLSIDENASPLASIAVVDRLGAYVQSQPILISILLIVLLSLVVRPMIMNIEWSWQTLTLVAVVTVVALLLWISTERAIAFWKGKEENNESSAVGTAGIVVTLHPLPDFFLTAISQRSMWAGLFWHNVWGPFWETIMFLWRSERQIAAMHEFRFDVAQELWKKLKIVDIELELSADHNDPVEQVILKQQFQELTQRLWIVTGEPRFREIEERGAIIPEDRTNGIVGLL